MGYYDEVHIEGYRYEDEANNISLIMDRIVKSQKELGYKFDRLIDTYKIIGDKFDN